MSVFDGINKIEEWTPKSGNIGKRISLAWHESWSNGNLTVPVLSAYSGDCAFWFSLDNATKFLRSHEDVVWIVGQSLEGFHIIEKLVGINFSERFRKQMLISLPILYGLIHIAEYQDEADSTTLDYLTDIYLGEELIARTGDFFPELLGLFKQSDFSKMASTSIAAIEMAIAAWEIFPAMWREASSSKTLLGYSHYSVAEYSLSAKDAD
jgi:hypothetical protein